MGFPADVVSSVFLPRKSSTRGSLCLVLTPGAGFTCVQLIVSRGCDGTSLPPDILRQSSPSLSPVKPWAMVVTNNPRDIIKNRSLFEANIRSWSVLSLSFMALHSHSMLESPKCIYPFHRTLFIYLNKRSTGDIHPLLLPAPVQTICHDDSGRKIIIVELALLWPAPLSTFH
jgi:hypothetical protein